MAKERKLSTESDVISTQGESVLSIKCDTVEDELCSQVREMSRLILKHVPSKADTIKVDARRHIREAAEAIRDLAVQMVGQIKQLKSEVKEKEEEIRAIKGKAANPGKSWAEVASCSSLGRCPPDARGKQDGRQGVAPRVFSYAAVASKHAIKITGKDAEQGNVSEILKKEINPTTAKINIATVKNTKSGAVIVECASKEDSRKLKMAVDLSSKLQGKEIKKGNPRIILRGIDKHISKEVLIEKFAENNQSIVDELEGLENFKDEVRERFRYGGKTPKSRTVAVVLEVSARARRAFLKDRVSLGWQSLYAEDHFTVEQCFKCYGYGHRAANCSEKSQHCGKCGSVEHIFKDCKSDTEKCIACVRHNQSKRGPAVDTKHDAKNPNCPSLIRAKNLLLNTINYE